jgi:phage shock protein A
MAGSEHVLTALKNQAEMLETTLSQLRRRIEELETKPKQA